MIACVYAGLVGSWGLLTSIAAGMVSDVPSVYVIVTETKPVVGMAAESVTDIDIVPVVPVEPPPWYVRTPPITMLGLGAAADEASIVLPGLSPSATSVNVSPAVPRMENGDTTVGAIVRKASACSVSVCWAITLYVP